MLLTVVLTSHSIVFFFSRTTPCIVYGIAALYHYVHVFIEMPDYLVDVKAFELTADVNVDQLSIESHKPGNSLCTR
ncbi:MAG: hypothetical protein WCG19_04880 [Chlorobiaceae bacterium]